MRTSERYQFSGSILTREGGCDNSNNGELGEHGIQENECVC